MNVKTIDIGDFTLENMIDFFSNYTESSHGKIIFDFQSCNKARLLPALVFNSWMKKIDHERAVINIDNSHGSSYLKNIGFFKALKIDKFKTQTIKFDTSKRHIPIIRFSYDYYQQINPLFDINHNITNEMKRVSSQIFDYVHFENEQSKLKSVNAMTFLLREIIRNVFEHSKADYHTIAMQIQESNNRIEIAILDEGVGIASSYTTNPLFRNYTQNPVKALDRALTPGSSRMYNNEVEISRKTTTWPNSGFGLFMCSRICARLHGSFNLISSGHHVRMTYSEESNEYKRDYFHNPLKGCAIGMEFNLEELSLYDKIYSKVLEEVEVLQRDLKNLYDNPSSYSNIASIRNFNYD